MTAEAKDRDIFAVDNGVSCWAGLRYLEEWTGIAIEKHIKNTHLKRVDAPVGVKPMLKRWMDLCE